MKAHRTIMLSLAITAALASPGYVAGAPGGYLAPGEFDVTTVVEPAPRPGDPRYQTDREIFRATRKLEGSPRWRLATSDVDYSAPAVLHDYSCAVGLDLTPSNAPSLVAVAQRAISDTGGQTGKAKDRFARQRPFMIDHGDVCQPPSELFDKKRDMMSYEYPSGHATLGWTWALILTAIDPERAQQILRRGRAFADSRFVCGVHNESAVEAGMQSASATMSLVSTKAAYQADLARARAEFAVLRAANPPPPQGCEAEAALVAERVMPRLDAPAPPPSR